MTGITYQLRFSGWGGSDDQRGIAAVFSVERSGVLRPLRLDVSGLAMYSSGIKDQEELRELLLSAGLREVRRMLIAGVFDEGEPRHVIDVQVRTPQESGALRVDDLLARRQKYCKYRKSSEAGPICGITAHDDPLGGMTLDQLCEACEVPDSDLACAHLVHLSTSGSETMGRPCYSRYMDRAACNYGRSLSSPSACIPGQCEAWIQVVTVSPPDEAVPSDIVDRIVDEIDYLNLAFKDRYGARLVQLTQARTIGDLGICCQGENDFTQLVAVVASLLAGIRVPENLLDDPETVKDKGSLTRLEAFLGRYHPNYDKTRVQRLKSITRIRNSHPIHPKTEGVSAAFGCLSIEYPIRDWQEAGRRVLGALWDGLRHLRTLIQYSGQEDDEQD
ncbi:MAG: hypothetical protein ACM3ZU_01400 [Bacteroidota bacterium]